MSNFKVTTCWIIALLSFSMPAFADWQADAAVIDGAAGTSTAQAITSFKGSVDQFQPPQPCVDTSKPTFQLGSPATLSCGGSSPGGNPGGGGGNEALQQAPPSDNTGVFQ